MTDIEDRKDLVEESVSKLKGVEVDSNEFYHFQGVKHTLQEAVEACIDIASRLISENGWGRGSSYSDYFETLADEGVIDSELSERLQTTARFRNFIVHRYVEIEEDELQKIIDEDLDDLIDFIDQVGKHQKNQDN